MTFGAEPKSWNDIDPVLRDVAMHLLSQLPPNPPFNQVQRAVQHIVQAARNLELDPSEGATAATALILAISGAEPESGARSLDDLPAAQLAAVNSLLMRLRRETVLLSINRLSDDHPASLLVRFGLARWADSGTGHSIRCLGFQELQLARRAKTTMGNAAAGGRGGARA